MNDAFEKLKRALAEPPLILHEQYPDGAPFVDWSPKVEEIREAVREAMKAVAEGCGSYLEDYGDSLKAEIDRLLGKETPS